MRDNALYFPYINVPNTGWFTRILLYWDKVSSIVPNEYVYFPEKLDPYMRELVAAELVHQVIPSKYIHNIPHFDEPFLEYIHSEFKQRNHKRVLRASSTSILHIEKIDRVANELTKLGLARPSNYPWYEVESWVADAFMAYLAVILGKLKRVNAAPVTDQKRVFRLLSDKTFQQRRIGVREVVLSNILPSPAKKVSINDLVNFKATHGNLLRRFRNKVESKCIELANISESEAMEDQIRYTISEFEEEITRITDAMRGRWAHIILTSTRRHKYTYSLINIDGGKGTS